jgi:hypothetical protein
MELNLSDSMIEKSWNNKRVSLSEDDFVKRAERLGLLDYSSSKRF